MYLRKSNNPELEEFKQKQWELSELINLLSEREEELEELLIQISWFEQKYYRLVASKYARLDELQAIIYEYLAQKYPHNSELQNQAQESRLKALESQVYQEQYLHSSSEQSDNFPFKPTEELRKIYKAIVRAIHPDLTTDEEAKVVRTRLMIEVNKAYQDNNILRLKTIWFKLINQSPIIFDDELFSQDINQQLCDLVETIAQVKETIKKISAEIDNLKEQPLYELIEKAITAQQEEERDLILEMSEKLDHQIYQAEVRLEELLAEGDG